MYFTGNGVEKDFSEAFRYYSLAAVQVVLLEVII